MICPICGFEQPAGENCSQCQTPLAAPKQSPLTEPTEQPTREAPRAVPAAKKPSPSPKPEDSSKPVAEPQISEKIPEPPPQKVEDKPVAPEKEMPATAKQDPVSEGVHEKLGQLERLILTSTPGVEGRQVLAYQGVVAATVLIRGALLKEILQDTAGEVVSIRSTSLQGAFEKARMVAIADLKLEAAKKGADAIVGLAMSHIPGTGGIWLSVVGTAVTLKA